MLVACLSECVSSCMCPCSCVRLNAMCMLEGMCESAWVEEAGGGVGWRGCMEWGSSVWHRDGQKYKNAITMAECQESEGTKMPEILIILSSTADIYLFFLRFRGACALFHFLLWEVRIKARVMEGRLLIATSCLCVCEKTYGVHGCHSQSTNQQPTPEPTDAIHPTNQTSPATSDNQSKHLQFN